MMRQSATTKGLPVFILNPSFRRNRAWQAKWTNCKRGHLLIGCLLDSFGACAPTVRMDCSFRGSSNSKRKFNQAAFTVA